MHMRDTKLLARVARDVGRWVKGGRSWVWPQKLWCKYQLPWRPHFNEYDVGPDYGLGIRAVEMGKVLMGRHWMTVRAFVIFSMACTVSKLAKMRGPVKGCVQESGGSRTRCMAMTTSVRAARNRQRGVTQLAPCWRTGVGLATISGEVLGVIQCRAS